MVDEVTPNDVKEKLDDESVQVVDIRQPRQFQQGHIPGALNIPMNELPTQVDEVDWEDEVVVTCPIGQSSVQAAKLIQSFENVDDETAIASMAGGYQDWEYELETATD
jgi:Rhodanese-related sulfurtransferase